MGARKSGFFLSTAGQSAPGVITFTKVADITLAINANLLAGVIPPAPQYISFFFTLDYLVDVLDEVYMTLNADGTPNYHYDLLRSVAPDTAAGAARFHIGTSGDMGGHAEGWIYVDNITALVPATAIIQFFRAGDSVIPSPASMGAMGGMNEAIAGPLTSIEFRNGLGANNWLAGTRLIIYGVERA